MKLHKTRRFRRRHGYEFPMLPRRPGLCLYPVCKPGGLFFKWPRRLFYSRYSAD